MTNQTSVVPAHDIAPEEQAAKKTYEKPQVIFQELLEAMAGSCTGSPAKTSPTDVPACSTLNS